MVALEFPITSRRTLPRRQLSRSQRRLLMYAVIAICIVAAGLFALRPVRKATRENFAKVQIGMSENELIQLLGRMDQQFVELGRVSGPESYTPNSAILPPQKPGDQEYRRCQWWSVEFIFTVIADRDGRVACRYATPRPKHSMLAEFKSWFVK